jgi:FkbM family methyltransferase
VNAGEFLRKAPGALRRRGRHAVAETPLGQAVRAARAILPRQRARFVWRDLTDSAQTLREWELKDGRRPVAVRSRSRDLDILREMFVEDVYAPPEAVTEILRHRGQLKIVDLGANIGLFGIWAQARWPGAELHGFEPDPTNLPVLDRNIALSSDSAHWTVTRACAAPSDGTIRFLSGRQSDSRAAYEADAGTDFVELPTVDVFPSLEGVDLLKIDIEGGEWPLLTDPRFDAVDVPAIVIEHHGYDCPGPGDSRDTARRLLETRGYTVLETEWHPVGVGTFWAWRA